MLGQKPTLLFSRLAARVRGDGHLRELSAGAGAAFAMRMSGKAMAYVFALVVARTLGAEAWGRFSLAFVVVNLGAIVALLGLDTVAVRFVAEARAAGAGAEIGRIVRRMLAVVLPWSVVVAVGVWAVSPLVADAIFGKSHLAGYFQRGAWAVPPFVVLTLCGQALRGLKRVGVSELLQQVLRTAFPLAVLWALLTFGSGEVRVLDAFVIGMWALAVVAGTTLAVLVRRQPGGEAETSRSTGELLRTSFPLLLAGSLVFLKGWIDTIMVGAFLDEAAVGVYDIAFKLGALIIIPLGAVNSIAAPKFAELCGTRDQAGLQRFVTYSTTAISACALPVFLALVLFPEVVLGLFGPEYVQAATALRIISVGMLINALAGSVGVFMQMTGRQVVYQYISVAVVAVSIALSYLLIPRFGINGAAVATTASLVAFNVAAAAYIWYKDHITVVWTPSLARSAFSG